MIDKGEYSEALIAISKFSDEIEFEKYMLTSQIYQDMEHNTRAIENGEKALTIANSRNKIPEIVLAQLSLARSFWLAGPEDPIPRLMKTASEGIKLIEEIEDIDNEYLTAYHETTIGIVSSSVGSGHKDGIAALVRALAILKPLDNSAELARAYTVLGILETAELSIPIFQKASLIWKSLDNSLMDGRTQCLIGGNYQLIGDFNDAISYNQKALLVADEVGDTLGTIRANGCLSNISLARGKPKDAITLLNKNNVKVKELDNLWLESGIGHNLGQAYFQIGLMRKAIDEFRVCLRKREELNLKAYAFISPLFHLIRAHLALDQISEAKEYEKQLQNFNKLDKTPKARYFSELAKILLLINSKRLKDKMQAQGLLEAINLDDPHLRWFLKILTLKNLAELLLLEIESEDNPALFIEVEQIIDQIVDVAKIQNLLALNVEALILQSKLKLVQGS
ncbi:MAG: hypothetical protein IH840_17735, partial [Candidatus Heimdallarchaeota archaeon]|nr:hypothetical protein [Candidatus Heimdallarchaeota archaeon]